MQSRRFVALFRHLRGKPGTLRHRQIRVDWYRMEDQILLLTDNKERTLHAVQTDWLSSQWG